MINGSTLSHNKVDDFSNKLVLIPRIREKFNNDIIRLATDCDILARR